MLSKRVCENGDICLDMFLFDRHPSSQTAVHQIFTQRRSGRICLIRDMSQSTLDLRHSQGSREGHVLQHHINSCGLFEKVKANLNTSSAYGGSYRG